MLQGGSFSRELTRKNANQNQKQTQTQTQRKGVNGEKGKGTAKAKTNREERPEAVATGTGFYASPQLWTSVGSKPPALPQRFGLAFDFTFPSSVYSFPLCQGLVLILVLLLTLSFPFLRFLLSSVYGFAFGFHSRLFAFIRGSRFRNAAFCYTNQFRKSHFEVTFGRNQNLSCAIRVRPHAAPRCLVD